MVIFKRYRPRSKHGRPGENHFLICATYMDAMEIMARFHQNAVIISSSAIVNDQMNQNYQIFMQNYYLIMVTSTHPQRGG